MRDEGLRETKKQDQRQKGPALDRAESAPCVEEASKTPNGTHLAWASGERQQFEDPNPPHLKRSELNLLVREVKKGRWPMSEGERLRCIELVMHTAETATTERSRLIAAKVMAEFDKLNMEQEKRDAGGDHLHLHVTKGPDLSVDELAKLPPDELLARHSQSLGLLPADKDDSADAPGAGGLPAGR